MTSGIKWLASFPKSGNTWARLFLLNWHADLDQPLDPNELGRTKIAPGCDTPWLWEEACGFNMIEHLSKCAAFLPERDADRVMQLSSFKLRSHVQRYYAKSPGELPPYLKTHSSNTTLAGRFPYIAWDATEAAVYFVRDPRKVAPSLADHMSWGMDKSVNMMADRDYFAAREECIFYHIGSWSEHVTSWQSHATMIRYEDLPDGFEAMMEAFGLPMDERFEKAKTFTQMQTLKWFESAKGFSEQAHEGHTFFGGKRKELTGSQTARIEETHEKVMREFGYL